MSRSRLVSLVAGCTFGVVFGAVDNALLWWALATGGEAMASAGQDAIAQALLANDFSDVGGVVAGLFASAWLRRVLRHDGETSTAQEGVGIGIGCTLVWLAYVAHWSLVVVPLVVLLGGLVATRPEARRHPRSSTILPYSVDTPSPHL